MAIIVNVETSQGNGVNCTKSEDLISGNAQEVCGSKNKSQEEAQELTDQGFICVEQ